MGQLVGNCSQTSVKSFIEGMLLSADILIEDNLKSRLKMVKSPQSASQGLAPEGTRDQVREIVYQIRRLMQAGELYTKELDKSYQVSVPQLSCILALYEHGPLPPSQIAKHIMVRSSTVTGIIDRLEQKGLVCRLRDSSDRRVITIQLTERGKELARNAPPPIQRKVVDGLNRLPQNRIERIVKSLREITRLLDVQDLDLR
jgi:DNA-binding MarR family transcriptional regulator